MVSEDLSPFCTLPRIGREFSPPFSCRKSGRKLIRKFFGMLIVPRAAHAARIKRLRTE
jgi:hypothetical protein